MPKADDSMTLDNLNDAFAQLNAARQADTGTKGDAAVIGSCAYAVAHYATELMENRRQAESNSLPNLAPLTNLVSAEQLAEMLKTVQPTTSSLNIQPREGVL